LHAGVVQDTGRLMIYWGESKLYESPTDAIRECLALLKGMLRPEEGEAAVRRDLQLLERYADLDDAALEAAFKTYLDPRDPHYNSLEFRGLGLVGFDCDGYPVGAGQNELSKVVQAVAAQLPGWKGHIGRRIGEEQLEGFSFHFICLPFPSAQAFRDAVRQGLGL